MNERRNIFVRPTTMALAFKECLERMGVDTAAARMPVKREPTWSVTRKAKG